MVSYTDYTELAPVTPTDRLYINRVSHSSTVDEYLNFRNNGTNKLITLKVILE